MNPSRGLSIFFAVLISFTFLSSCGLEDSLLPDNDGKGTTEVRIQLHDPDTLHLTNPATGDTISFFGTSLVMAVPAGTAPADYHTLWNTAVYSSLLDMTDASVTMVLPEDTSLQLFEYIFRDAYTYEELRAGTFASAPPIVSDPFTLDGEITDLSLIMPLGSIGRPSTVAAATPIAVGDTTCPNGGYTIEVGVDENGNGLLDSPDEVDDTIPVCNGTGGTAGTDGLSTVTTTTPLLVGDATCTYGGNIIKVGADDNANGLLDVLEIDHSVTVCNGIDSYYAAGYTDIATGTMPVAYTNSIATAGDNAYLMISGLTEGSYYKATLSGLTQDLDLVASRSPFLSYTSGGMACSTSAGTANETCHFTPNSAGAIYFIVDGFKKNTSGSYTLNVASNPFTAVTLPYTGTITDNATNGFYAVSGLTAGAEVGIRLGNMSDNFSMEAFGDLTQPICYANTLNVLDQFCLVVADSTGKAYVNVKSNNTAAGGTFILESFPLTTLTKASFTGGIYTGTIAAGAEQFFKLTGLFPYSGLNPAFGLGGTAGTTTVDTPDPLSADLDLLGATEFREFSYTNYFSQTGGTAGEKIAMYSNAKGEFYLNISARYSGASVTYDLAAFFVPVATLNQTFTTPGTTSTPVNIGAKGGYQISGLTANTQYKVSVSNAATGSSLSIHPDNTFSYANTSIYRKDVLISSPAGTDATVITRSDSAGNIFLSTYNSGGAGPHSYTISWQ